MPFAQTTVEHTEDYWTKHFDVFLKPIIEEGGDFIAKRSEALRGDIQKQIISDLIVSPVVLADLTDKNPNVFWELGVRQSFKHGTITIAEDGTKLPFDISNKGTLFYHPKNHLKDQEFRQSLKHALKDCLNNPNSSDSLVLDSISGRGTLFEIFRREEALRRLDALISEYAYAQILAKHIINSLKKNEIATSRFRFSSTELLVTTRYLEEDIEFYFQAEQCLDALVLWNDQLCAWTEEGRNTENWYKEKQARLVKKLTEFETQLKSAQQKLLKSA